MSKQFIRCLDWLIPRFITEDVAIIYDEVTEHIEVICALQDIRPGEYYNYIATGKGFNLFGIAFNGTLSNFRKVI